MFKRKFIISITTFIIFLIITSIIKNKTRVIEKEITSMKIKIASLEKNINEAQLEFYYLTSPAEIEKRINVIGYDNYQPISYSKIFFNISELKSTKKNISKLNISNEKKNQKKVKISIKRVFILKII